MALSLKDGETDRLAREVAALTGESITSAIHALMERLERETRRRGQSAGLAERLTALGRDCAALPDVDARDTDDILGYDEHGMWS